MATHPKFELKKSKNDQFFFRLTAKNGQVIARSEMYTTRAAAENGIDSVKTNAPIAANSDANPKFDLKEATNGEFHFNLTAKNGQVIASSEMYTTKAAAENGINSVTENAPLADIEDLTEAA